MKKQKALRQPPLLHDSNNLFVEINVKILSQQSLKALHFINQPNKTLVYPALVLSLRLEELCLFSSLFFTRRSSTFLSRSLIFRSALFSLYL